jgi:hypothetical protein
MRRDEVRRDAELLARLLGPRGDRRQEGLGIGRGRGGVADSCPRRGLRAVAAEGRSGPNDASAAISPAGEPCSMKAFTIGLHRGEQRAEAAAAVAAGIGAPPASVRSRASGAAPRQAGT